MSHRPPMRVLVSGACAMVMVALAGCGCDPATRHSSAGGTSQGTAAPAIPAADNTAKNSRDDGSTMTPLDQGTSDADMGTTQAIRKDLMADKNLSLNGQNVKIITKDGVVTLRGPVASEAERGLIVAQAKKTAGMDRVRDQLEIASH